MAVNFALATGTTGTGTGAGSAVDCTSSGFGTPTAAVVFATLSGNGVKESYGIWDGTSSYAVGIQTGDALTSSNTGRAADSSAIVIIPNLDGTSVVFECTIASTTNGVTITPVTNTNSAAYKIHVMLIQAENASVDVTTVPLTSGTGNGNTITTGHSNDLIFALSMTSSNALPEQQQEARISFGYSDGTNYFSRGHAAGDAEGTSSNRAFADTTDIAYGVTEATIDWKCAIENQTTTAYDVYKTAGTGTGDDIFLLSLDMGTANFAIGSASVPTTVSTDVTISNGGSWTPSFAMVTWEAVFATNTSYATGCFAGGTILRDTNFAAIAVVDEDGQATTDAESIIQTNASSFNFYDDDGVAEVTWDECALESGQVRLGYSTKGTPGENWQVGALMVQNDGLPVYVGSSQVSGIYVGSTGISALYVGSTKIWP